MDEAKRYDQQLHDHGISVGVNYERTFAVREHFAPVLKGGGYGEYKTRDFVAPRFGYNLLDNGCERHADWDYSVVFADENIETDHIYMMENTNKSDSYAASTKLGAAYVADRLNYREKLHADVGVRMEYYNLVRDGYEADGIKPVHLDPSMVDVFSSLNVAYHLNDKNQIRLGYGRSVNRPEFREIVPYVYSDFEQFANRSGEPTLKNAYADNLDVRYEFYPSPGEMFTVGAFYKRFEDPIEQTFHEAGSGVQYTFLQCNAFDCLWCRSGYQKIS